MYRELSHGTLKRTYQQLSCWLMYDVPRNRVYHEIRYILHKCFEVLICVTTVWFTQFEE